MELFDSRAALYDRFIASAQYSAGLARVLRASTRLHNGMRLLDAGCGSGAVTFALLAALRSRRMSYAALNAFDLNETMLGRFGRRITRENVAGVQSCRANVLQLERLPAGWRDYDLIVSSGMLEYLDLMGLESALRGLRALLSKDGSLIIFVSKDNWLMRWLIKKWWRSHLYSPDEVRTCLARARYANIERLSFPATHFWLNLWGSAFVAS